MLKLQKELAKMINEGPKIDIDIPIPLPSRG
jgi:hypothetical protein